MTSHLDKYQRVEYLFKIAYRNDNYGFRYLIGLGFRYGFQNLVVYNGYFTHTYKTQTPIQAV